MKKINYWACFLMVLVSVAGCSDEVLDSKKNKAWVKPVNEETCAAEHLKMVTEEYGKEISGGLGDACFLRTATPSFAFYSPKKMDVRRIVIDKNHCTEEMLKEIEGSEGAEMVISACKNIGKSEGMKSSGKKW